MQIDIKLHQNDLPDEIKLDDNKSLAVNSEFSGLNVNRISYIWFKFQLETTMHI